MLHKLTKGLQEKRHDLSFQVGPDRQLTHLSIITLSSKGFRYILNLSKVGISFQV